MWVVLIFSMLMGMSSIAQNELELVKKAGPIKIEPNQITISWSTNIPSMAYVRYGVTEDMKNTITDTETAIRHEILLSNLTPATFYHVQTCSTVEEKEICAAPILFSTSSLSSGEIKVYFNHFVDSSVSNGASPSGTTPTAAQAAIVELIDNAQTSIDFCVYDMSRPLIIDALKAAHNRGVTVRYITDAETDNTGLNINPPFPVLRGNVGNHFMHNKFIAVDVNSVDNSYVLTGSMNMTYNGVLSNANNFVIIQDQALAAAYQLEFEEMWGSTGSQPDTGNAKFGDQKTDNTPHIFNINGKTVECYFSPSDNTTDYIEDAILSGDNDVEFALFAFTMWQLRDAIIAEKDAGKDVRGIIEMSDGGSTAYNNLLSHNVNVVDHPLSMLLHHKYGIVDAFAPNSDPLVITGSHNWSYSAETYNDENTVIIHDADIANIYLQEFEARWGELVDVADIMATSRELQLTPNPVVNDFELNYSGTTKIKGNLSLIDYAGRRVKSFGQYQLGTNQMDSFDVADVTPGTYVLVFEYAKKIVFAKPLIKIQ